MSYIKKKSLLNKKNRVKYLFNASYSKIFTKKEYELVCLKLYFSLKLVKY